VLTAGEQRSRQANCEAIMRSIILLAAAAIAVPFIISLLAPASAVGTAVSDRFLERSNTIPPEQKTKAIPINEANLRAWVTSEDTAKYASAYAWRVMPFDFVYLAVLGGFLALGAYTLASEVAWPPMLAKLPLWIWLIFPAAYIITDFLEDSLIILMMTQPSSISDLTVQALTFLRGTKIFSNALAITQIFALGLAGAIWV
jgi:hypothetical protein